MNPLHVFRDEHYICHNRARLAHFDSMGFNLNGKTVLEVGAGVGDHSEHLLLLGAILTITEPRLENLSILWERFPDKPVFQLDLNKPPKNFPFEFDFGYCYGTLYHLSDPIGALEFLSRICKTLLLETCVSYGGCQAINKCEELAENPIQSIDGGGCRPTRKWVYLELSKTYPFVYTVKTQPDHSEFPLVWDGHESDSGLKRAIFVASKERLLNPILVEGLVEKHDRYKPS